MVKIIKDISLVDYNVTVLVKVVKSDVCEWRVFAEPVTYYLLLITDY